MGWGKSKKKAEQGITQAGAMSPEERAAEQQRAEVDKLLQSIYAGKTGATALPSGYISSEQQFRGQGELAETLYNQTLTEAKDPYAFYESTLQPQLKLIEDYINNKMQQRGLLRSGLSIEEMGRAGSELAISEANARLQARANALTRAGQLSEYTSGLEQTQLSGLQNIAGRAGQVGQAGRTRGAAYESAPYEAQLSDIYGRKAAAYALPGQVIGAVGTAAGAGFNPFQTSSKKLTELSDYMTPIRKPTMSYPYA